MKQIVLVVSGVLLFSGCSSNNNICEDATLASEQVQQCQSLHKQIINAKQRPLIRTELERRYQQDCIDIRYYRDDKQVGVCGNKAEVVDAQKLSN
jgi:hypothetical protein